MTKFIRALTLPTVIAFGLVIPLVLLEAYNTSLFATYGFPAMLFLTLWLLAFVFVIVLRQAVRSLRVSSKPTLALFVGAAVLVLVGVFWVGLVADQMPCFMGVPNCD